MNTDFDKTKHMRKTHAYWYHIMDHNHNQYFIITFSYTKYFVHSYTVDVVLTLSYVIRTSLIM